MLLAVPVRIAIATVLVAPARDGRLALHYGLVAMEACGLVTLVAGADRHTLQLWPFSNPSEAAEEVVTRNVEYIFCTKGRVARNAE
jgi:hypothetical protein